MKTALYESNIVQNTNAESTKIDDLLRTQYLNLFFTQWSIRLTSRYNVTLFLSISLIFRHYSAKAYSSSDNNYTCAGFTVNRQKMLIDHVPDKGVW